MSKHLILRVCAAVCLLAIILATLPQRANALVDGNVSDPANQTVGSGAAVTISVTANANVGIAFNWQRMDATGLALSNVSGISGSTLSF